MTPIAYLRLPRRERRFCEAYLLAEAIKQKRQIEAQKEEHNEKGEQAKFDNQATSWAAEVKRRWQQVRR